MTTLPATVERVAQTADQWAMLAEADPVASAQLTPWRNGPATADVSGETGADDAVRTWVSANCTKPGGVVVMLGSGRDLHALVTHLPDGYRLLVLERDAKKLARQLHGFPFGTHASVGRLVLAIGDDPAQVQKRFQSMWRIQEEPEFLLYQGNADADSAAFYHSALSDTIRDTRLRLMNAGTMIAFGAMWQFNTLRNLPRLASQPGVGALAGAFAGRPAIVIGAGPSLTDALPHLKAAAPGAVTLAVATALRPLRKAGIRPDLVVAVDGHPKTAHQFEAPCEDLFLACSTLVYPPAVGRFRGAFAGTLQSNPIDAWLDTLLPPRGYMLAAGTVTSSALDLAVRMGCNPILTVGFDLCFNGDGTTHATNTMYHGVRVDTTHGEIVWVPGNTTDRVPTSRQFSQYIDLAAHYIAQTPGTDFINVNSGGARIPGMTVAPIRDMDRLVGPPGDAFGEIAAIHAAHRSPGIEPLATALREQARPLECLVSDARRAASLCNCVMRELQSPAPDRTSVESLLAELERTDANLTTAGLSSQIVEMSLWAASFALNAQPDLSCRVSQTSGVSVNRQWRRFYEQIAGAAMWTRDILQTVIADFEHTPSKPANTGTNVQHQGRSI